MIKSIRLQNFFSFRDTTIELNPDVNILVGINASGKSNLFKALRLLHEGVAGIGIKELFTNHWGGFVDVCNSGSYVNGKPGAISIEYVFDCNAISKHGFPFKTDVHYKIVFTENPTENYRVSEKLFVPNFKDGSLKFLYLDISNGLGRIAERVVNENESGSKINFVQYENLDSQELYLSKVFDNDRYHPQFVIRKLISEMAVYDYFDTRPFSAMRRGQLPTSEPRLLPNGENLIQVLNTIRNINRSNYGKIMERLNKINPHFQSINYKPSGVNIELMLEEAHLERAIHVAHVSDGTLRYLCLLAIFFNNQRGNIVCIDEPEIGLHPDMIRGIAKAIEEAGETSQIIISTHSESLLNKFRLQNIIVLEKDDSNQTICMKYDEDEFAGWYKEFHPGKMWSNGDIGGNRW